MIKEYMRETKSLVYLDMWTENLWRLVMWKEIFSIVESHLRVIGKEMSHNSERYSK